MTFVLQEVSAAEWAAFTDQRPDAHLLQRRPWGELKARFGWQPQYIVVRTAQTIVGGAQMLWRSQWGLRMAYVPRGPVWASQSEANDLLIKGLARAARNRRAVFLRLEPNQLVEPAWDAQHTRLLLAGYHTTTPLQPEASIQLDLTADTDTLLRNASKGHRADVRRAERKGVTVYEGSTSVDLETFYTIMQATAARANFDLHSFEYYSQAWQIFQRSPAEAVQILIARHESQAIAAFMVFAAGTEAQYLYSGSTEAGLKLGASHALQWAAIQWAKTQGCMLYDFWGIPLPFALLETTSDPQQQALLEAQAQASGMAGIYRFKKGWGGTVVRYVPAYDRVFLAPVYWLWQRRRGSHAA